MASPSQPSTSTVQQELRLPSDHGQKLNGFSGIANFLWSIADLLRGSYRQSDYGKVILPMTVLRRLDCVLRDTKPKVLAKAEAMKGGKVKEQNLGPVLNRITGVPFHNVSKLDFEKLKGDPNHIAANLLAYIKGFSPDARDIFLERFGFATHIEKLARDNLLYLVFQRFAEVDLHPKTVPNHTMGLIFEELIRRFAEQSNETAGEHFTPREVIRLMVDLLFVEDDDTLRKPGMFKTLYDPACGTGGMLSVAEEYLRELNPQAKLEVFGQELNDESFAICKADMMIKGQNPSNITPGNSFTEDGHTDTRFDYMLSNPPFGVDWKQVQKVVEEEHETQGYSGRFGAGLPRINDGSTLFLLHMLSKMKPVKDGGSRLAIVFNGSPLFSGDAGSGESEIRRWVIENDWLEAIVGLPDQLFYNTGISTYVWVVTNRKPAARRGKVQLINAVDLFQKMRKSLGNKRNELSQANIDEIVKLYGEFNETERSKIFDNDDFGYRRIVVEQPLRLAFQATPERIERLKSSKPFERIAQRSHEASCQILETLAAISGKSVWKNPQAFDRALNAAHVSRHGQIMISDAMRKAVHAALGERDETADICCGPDGNPEPDADLRDYENVPRKEDIQAYFNREVKPHLPDAWIDEANTRDGYEIPFTRNFYTFTPLRPVADIEGEIRELEGEIAKMLGAVLG